MTHGLTDGQFFNMVSSFLGPYYLALALMNGLAAFRPAKNLVEPARTGTWQGGNQQLAGLARRGYLVFHLSRSRLGGDGFLALFARGISRHCEQVHWPRLLQYWYDCWTGGPLLLPKLLRQTGSRLDNLEPNVAVSRPLDDR